MNVARVSSHEQIQYKIYISTEHKTLNAIQQATCAI